MAIEREFDIIIWGASGFTGRLVAEYLFSKYGVNNSIKWAMAGRNQEKLEQVRLEFTGETVPIIIADSEDEVSLSAMTKRAKVICTTVGPYAKYGSKLVAACVQNHTHYCDLAGEPQWIRKMIDQHHETAKTNGTKIVHCCGFDSIPSDMGVYFIQKEAIAKTGAVAKEIKMRVKAFSGKVSGGTIASMNYVMEQASLDKSIYETLFDPYGLNPKGERTGPDKKDLETVTYDKVAKSWIYPFVMASINTKIVRRSNALLGYHYHKEFKYEEAVMTGTGIIGITKAVTSAVPIGLLMLSKPGSLIKKGINRFLPNPGEGPNKEKRETGFYNLRFYSTLQDGSLIVSKVTGDMDPGYGSTSKMLAESAICLAKDELPPTAGSLTPASAMGDPLLKRLVDQAGLTFTFDIEHP